MKPVLIVIAGPNGAGKTTVTARLRAERWSEGVEYLNPDEIARDRFGDWNSPDAILKAAEWTTQRREELLAQGAGLAFETVLSTDEKIDFLARSGSPRPPCLGGVAIAERHVRRFDEDERLLRKHAAGCRFFISPTVFDAACS